MLKKYSKVSKDGVEGLYTSFYHYEIHRSSIKIFVTMKRFHKAYLHSNPFKYL